MPFVGASPSSTLRMLEHTLSRAHGWHVHPCIKRALNTDAHRHISTCTRPHCPHIHAHSYTLMYLHPMTHTHLQYMLTKAHTQSNPHHPWVMNNICLSIPPSLPLAWLLASSWLHCHNVILSASLSPITKMCSDNQAFSHRPLPSHQTGTSSSDLHIGLIK